MVSIDLDVTHQQRLEKLAASLGSNSAKLAQQILVDYLDFQALSADTEEAWAEAAVALVPEIMQVESWDEPGHGSK